MKITITENINELSRSVWDFSVTPDRQLKLLSYRVETRNSLWTWEEIHRAFVKIESGWNSFLDPAFGKKQPKVPTRVLEKVKSELKTWVENLSVMETTPKTKFVEDFSYPKIRVLI